MVRYEFNSVYKGLSQADFVSSGALYLKCNDQYSDKQ